MVRPINHPSLLDHIVVPPIWAKLSCILTVQVTITVHSERGKGYEGTFRDQNRTLAAIAAAARQECVLCGKAAVKWYGREQTQGYKGDVVSCQSLELV